MASEAIALPRRRAVGGLTPQAKREERYFYAFISPWFIGFVVFTAGPILASIYFSFTVYDVMRPPDWTGLSNYSSLLADRLFWQSLRVTALYSAGSVPLGILASLTVALLLNRDIYGVAGFRTIFYLPSVISGVAVSLLWMWIFNPDFGILNYALWKLFRIQGPAWIMSERWVIPSLIFMSLWGIGGGIVIYLAGLQGIPTELYEAASIDGAGSWTKLLRITLPMMSPVILFNLVTGIIGSFQVFTQAYVMTAGGPHNASLFYVLYLYRNAFYYFRMGFASALAWVLFIIILVLTLLVFRSSPLWVYYESVRG
ncbi:MAG: sugar ABC transporter permease [Anaerolineae bacterium]|nr:sugar ABC transporter permease [Anaerolineae bacterium]